MLLGNLSAQLFICLPSACISHSSLVRLVAWHQFPEMESARPFQQNPVLACGQVASVSDSRPFDLSCQVIHYCILTTWFQAGRAVMPSADLAIPRNTRRKRKSLEHAFANLAPRVIMRLSSLFTVDELRTICEQVPFCENTPGEAFLEVSHHFSSIRE